MKKISMIILFSAIASVQAQQKEPTNKHFWNTVETSASPEKIWTIWTDVSQWKTWDTGLKDALMSDPFKLGAKGTIVSLEGRKSKFKVVEYEEGLSYTIKTKLPLGSLYVKRTLSTQSGKTIFTHEVWFKGLTGGLFAKRFGPKFRKMLPEVMLKIKQLAESK